ncbi:MAG: hypothetical protein II085_04545 [Alphaproteobacteria bacterium]|nr:hypothetical protein [Alphaproteobacteria bacterium]
MDDDIFSDPKKAQDNKEDSNMDWKKSGIDKNERITRKIDAQEANAYNANKSRDTKPKIKARIPVDVPKGFKKIRKKIRDVYDEEEDDDGDYILVPVFEDREISSLERALTPQEKKQLAQMEAQQPEDINIRQSIDRDIKLRQVETTLKKAGIEVAHKTIEQQRTQATNVDAKRLAEEGLKKRRKQKEKQTPVIKNDATVKPAKELPKIKDPETKEIRKALIDDAEKDKQSIQKNIERKEQEKSEINTVTKEKQTKIQEAEKTQVKEEQTPTKGPEKQPEEPQPEKDIQPDNSKPSAEKTQTSYEEAVRRLILEKSGRITPEPEPEEKKEQLEREIAQNQRQLRRDDYSR